ncbi:hypothetical protein [Porphyrobacter sp. GA68]|uniref:hypothetical protein n=1 Tax=Porphyrobacter sp. GA68 TaxID=2883480 RepID=UPI001D17EE72|nr:hypothetical protein [Porphyrobacter sp. GA68]
MTALIKMVSGLIAWAVSFSVLYALHGLGCALGWTEQAVPGLTQARVVLLVTWILLIAAHGVLLVWLLRSCATQMQRIGVAIGWIGLGATIVTGLPILAISSCV